MTKLRANIETDRSVKRVYCAIEFLLEGSLDRSHYDIFIDLILLISSIIVCTATESPVPAYYNPIARMAPPIIFI